MDDPKKKSLIERMAAASEGIKLNPEIMKAAEEVSRSMGVLKGFSLPTIQHRELRIPDLPPIPTTEERNEYQSASVLMNALAKEALQWKGSLPANFRPAILAVLYGGIQIHVKSLSQVSFHGIKVEGTMNGAPCSVLAHQATFQLLCYAEEIKDDSPRSPIGFIWGDQKLEV